MSGPHAGSEADWLAQSGDKCSVLNGLPVSSANL